MMDFSLWNWLRQGHAGPPTRPDLPFARLLSALRLRPRRALSSAQAKSSSMPATRSFKQNGVTTYRIPILIARTSPVLIAPRH